MLNWYSPSLAPILRCHNGAGQRNFRPSKVTGVTNEPIDRTSICRVATGAAAY